MAALSYLFDENMPEAFSEDIRRRYPELVVHVVGDGSAPGKGTSDPDVLDWCQAHGCALVTNNRKSRPRHIAKGGRIDGIFVFSRTMNMRRMSLWLYETSLLALPGEFENRIHYIPND